MNTNMNMSMTDMMISLTSKADTKVGYTTTVKEQVDDMEVLLWLCRTRLITSTNLSICRGNCITSYSFNSKNWRKVPGLAGVTLPNKSIKESTMLESFGKMGAKVRIISLNISNCRTRLLKLSMKSWTNSQIWLGQGQTRSKLLLAFDHSRFLLSNTVVNAILFPISSIESINFLFITVWKL